MLTQTNIVYLVLIVIMIVLIMHWKWSICSCATKAVESLTMLNLSKSGKNSSENRSWNA